MSVRLLWPLMVLLLAFSTLSSIVISRSRAIPPVTHAAIPSGHLREALPRAHNDAAHSDVTPVLHDRHFVELTASTPLEGARAETDAQQGAERSRDSPAAHGHASLLSALDVGQYEQTGFVVLRNFASEAVLEMLRSEFRLVKRILYVGWPRSARLRSNLLQSPYGEVASKVLRSENIRLWEDNAYPVATGYGWHVDMAASACFSKDVGVYTTVWVPLVDVNPLSGGGIAFANSSLVNKACLEAYKLTRLVDSRCQELLREIELIPELKAGDAVVFDPVNTFHRTVEPLLGEASKRIAYGVRLFRDGDAKWAGPNCAMWKQRAEALFRGALPLSPSAQAPLGGPVFPLLYPAMDEVERRQLEHAGMSFTSTDEP